MTFEISETSELRRVRDLPRRVPVPGLVDQMTPLLSCDGGAMRLREKQALALYEMHGARGAYCGSMTVGEGKTLVAALAPYVLDAKRSVLIVRGSLVQKTQRDMTELRRHWMIPDDITIVTYEALGLVANENLLEVLRPDLIISDECQRLSNTRAAVTRRVARYMREHPDTMFVALSGTGMKRSVLDFGHVLRWCLKDGAPVPATQHELADWACALDEDSEVRLKPGALMQFASPEDVGDMRTRARKGFRRRLISTPGVIANTDDAEPVHAELHIRAITYDMSTATDAAYHTLRTAWVSPADGYPYNSAAEVWAHAKELALGLSYVWKPRPPPEWLRPRSEWGAFVRATISHSRSLDSEKAVALAVESGRIADGGALARWRAVADTFEPHPESVWHDDSVLRVCVEWARRAPGIVWTEHAFFAARLAELSGLSYYGAKGLDAKGRFIDDAPGDVSIIASADANREGRNLQTKWSRNLVVSPNEGADWWEQLIGRTHRPGQASPVVVVDVLLGCAEHARAWRKALSNARSVRDTTGAQQKLLIAKVEWPSDRAIEGYIGARWRTK